MNNSTKQTMALIGIALIAVSGVLFYVALRQPKVYENAQSASQTAFETVAQSIPEEKGSEVTTQASTEAPSDKAAETQKEIRYPLNLNKATAEELMTIDGLGEKRAYAIIEYREHIGGYKSVDQIMQIKGIDDDIFSQVAGYLTV